MALRSCGTNASTSLLAMVCGSHVLGAGLGIQNAANVAITNSRIKDDLINGNPLWPNAFQGLAAGPLAGGGGSLLYIPNRGVLQVFLGDYIATDSTGWPILISANAMANGPWSHSGNAP